MRISHHPAHAFERCDFLRRPLRVATGHQDLAIGILPVNSADGGAGIGIGRCGDGAGVQHHHGSVASAASRQSTRFQRALNGGAIGLLRPAAKIHHLKSFRHMFIIASANFPAGHWSLAAALGKES